MDTSLQVGTTLIAVGCLLACWLLGWRRLYIDRYRQSLYELRDQLFDLAVAGRIPFDSPIYVSMRNSFHLRIRFAHRANLYGFLISWIVGHFTSLSARNFYQERRGQIEQLRDSELRQRLLLLEEQAVFLTVDHVLSSSLVLRFVVLPFARLANNLKALKEIISESIILTDNTTEAEEDCVAVAF